MKLTRRPRVLFVTPFDPADPQAWSGTPHYMRAALSELADVEMFQTTRPRTQRLLDRWGRSLPEGRQKRFNRSRFVLDAHARELRSATAAGRFDVVFSPASVPLSHANLRTRTVFWTDAVFHQLVNLYPDFSGIDAATISRGILQETSALERSTLAVYSSRWAERSAHQLLPAARTAVLPFGPNMDAEWIAALSARRAARPASGPIKMLWIGVDWQRKGGAHAIDVLDRLAEAGVDARLDIVGVRAPVNPRTDVISHGTLSKFVPSQREALSDLLVDADVLLLPSLADCTPIVLSEAAAIGLSVATSNVGGMGETVDTFELGFAHALDEDFAAEAARWVAGIRDRPRPAAGADSVSAAMDYRKSFATMLDRVLDNE